MKSNSNLNFIKRHCRYRDEEQIRLGSQDELPWTCKLINKIACN